MLDPRASLTEAIGVTQRHAANLLLAELVGAAQHHKGVICLDRTNIGRSWRRVFNGEGIELHEF